MCSYMGSEFIERGGYKCSHRSGSRGYLLREAKGYVESLGHSGFPGPTLCPRMESSSARWEYMKGWEDFEMDLTQFLSALTHFRIVSSIWGLLSWAVAKLTAPSPEHILTGASGDPILRLPHSSIARGLL